MKIFELEQKLSPAAKPPIKFPTRVKPATKPKELGQTLQSAGMPILTAIQAPPMPTELDDGERLDSLPNGNFKYYGGFGAYTYDKTGRPLTYQTPSFAGLSQTNDLVSGTITVRYIAGPLDVSAKFDKAGKPLDSMQMQMNLGLGVLGFERDQGITTKSYKSNSPDGEDPVMSQRDLYAMGNKDKEQTYDRAMAQVQKEDVEAEPTQQDIQQVQQLLGTIDVAKEQPQTLLNKLTGWMKDYPMLDKVTDIIPQTRLIKSIARALDALEAGDPKLALNSLAGAVGGNLAQAARAVNVGSALAQGDVKQAALSAGGNVATVAKAAGAAQNLAQGNAMGAISQFAPGAAKLATAAQTALAPQQKTEFEPVDEVQRIKQLARIQ